MNWHLKSLDPLQQPIEGSLVAGPSHLGHRSLFMDPTFMVYQSVKSPNERKPGMQMSTYGGEKRRKNIDRYSDGIAFG